MAILCGAAKISLRGTDFLSLKNDVNVPSKSNKQKKLGLKICFLLAS
jgi:hypothetical protein